MQFSTVGLHFGRIGFDTFGCIQLQTSIVRILSGGQNTGQSQPGHDMVGMQLDTLFQITLGLFGFALNHVQVGSMQQGIGTLRINIEGGFKQNHGFILQTPIHTNSRLFHQQQGIVGFEVDRLFVTFHGRIQLVLPMTSHTGPFQQSRVTIIFHQIGTRGVFLQQLVSSFKILHGQGILSIVHVPTSAFQEKCGTIGRRNVIQGGIIIFGYRHGRYGSILGSFGHPLIISRVRFEQLQNGAGIKAHGSLN
mmetsp:Transcript_5234/g.11058  ORF Transcript_5234/g.11058 Transcript_5234/m.11058 type:complete len:250 (-) Transcript_5234:349-1098(-)